MAQQLVGATCQAEIEVNETIGVQLREITARAIAAHYLAARPRCVNLQRNEQQVITFGAVAAILVAVALGGELDPCAKGCHGRSVVARRES